MVVLAIGLYLGLLLFTAMPSCQHWMAGKASELLSKELGSEVRIGHARIGLLNRIVLDDILLNDQNGDTLLSATRLSSKIDLLELINGRIRIANVQLFGYDLRLHRANMQSPYNFQYIIDYFASEDTTSTPLDLAINSIIVRRGSVSHDIDEVPCSERFNVSHVKLDDLNIKAEIGAVTRDSISFNINELSFIDSRSGFSIKNLSGEFHSNHNSSILKDVNLELSNTKLQFPLVTLKDGLTKWEQNAGKVVLKGEVTPSDLKAFYPPLHAFDKPLTINLNVEKDRRQVTLKRIHMDGEGLLLQLQGEGMLLLNDSTAPIPFEQLELNCNRLNIRPVFYQPILHALSNIQEDAPLTTETAQMLTRLGDISIQGNIKDHHPSGTTKGQLYVQTSLGNAKVEGNLRHHDIFNIHAETNNFLLASLLNSDNDIPLDNLNLTANLQGSITQKAAKGNAQLQDFSFKGTRLKHLESYFDISRHILKTKTQLIDDAYNFTLTTDLHNAQEWKFNVNGFEQMEGYVGLDNVSVKHQDEVYELRQLHLSTNNDAYGHHLLVSGDFIDAHADGHYHYASMVPTVQHFLHNALPSLIAAPDASLLAFDDKMNFSVQVWNTTQLLNLADINLHLPEPGYVVGEINVPNNEISMMADFPHIIYDNEELRAVSMLARQESDSLVSFVTLQRMMENGPMDLSVLAEGGHDRLNTVLAWDDHNTPTMRGELSANAYFFRDDQAKLGADIHFQPTNIIISDTIWNVHSSKIRYYNDIVDVSGFEVSQQGRHLRVDGRVSKDPADTLYAHLQGINLQYVFGIIDFHDVEFEGLATGNVKVHDIYTSLAVDANLQVHQLVLNGGLLGEAHVIGGFGRKDDKAIDIDVLIREPIRGQLSRVDGIIKPGHEPGRGLNLNINAQYLNTYFINFFTEGIFTDLQGRTSGYAHLHGPFKKLDLEGKLVLDTLSVGIDVLGTRYHTHGGDSLILHTGGIRIPHAQLYDAHHNQDQREHRAVLNGELRYEHFKNLRYTFNITAHDFLGYDFRDFGDQTFYGTVFANGQVQLTGEPGTLTVDVQCRPTQGTVFTYNVSTPTTLTDNEFITYKSREVANPDSVQNNEYNLIADNSANGSLEAISTTVEDEDDEPMDMHINFDLDITPDAQMRLLMDASSEDYINLYGNAHIRANFYNKGSFQMYGTYRVDHGTYRLSLQDVIRKEFRFQQGSTIVFGGNPMKGTLDLQAIYTVPSVSLNDLSAGSNFSNSNVRVNCLMNISGRPEQPQVSFDFDIPNVNEDEKQMIRSLISTDEERNLQVIYLLGIGRFYTYGLDANESQTTAAMQSLLSSTISGQLNDLLGTMIGNSNWNFGTNLSTGTQGWNEVDVEGMLSGRLLNNRLLINGTFGYRDTPIANTNFIGDFDVQWLLTPSGNISLKAYSETNDRYFTKTALTTQGVGIQVKKDFNTLRELFHKTTRRSQR